MNEILSNLTVLYNKIRTYHYNVVGANFHDTHLLLEDEYERMHKWIDEIAENMKAEGEIPFGTLSEMLENSSVDEVNAKDFGFQEIFVELSKDYEMLIRKIRVLKEISNGARVSLLEDLENELLKANWFFQATTKEAK